MTTQITPMLLRTHWKTPAKCDINQQPHHLTHSLFAFVSSETVVESKLKNIVAKCFF